ATPDVCGTAGDSGTTPSGVAKVELSIQRGSDSQYWNGTSWQVGVAWNLTTTSDNWAHWSYGFGPGENSYTVVSRATDKATNVESAPSSPDTTTLVDSQQPNTQITFPVNNTDYNTTTYTAGCTTPVAGDICGTASDPVKTGSLGPASGLNLVELSIKQN